MGLIRNTTEPNAEEALVIDSVVREFTLSTFQELNRYLNTQELCICIKILGEIKEPA